MTDLSAVRARRLGRKARPLGVEVRVEGTRFALHGPDRGLYLVPDGVSRTVRWLTYDDASAALDGHLANAGPPP